MSFKETPGFVISRVCGEDMQGAVQPSYDRFAAVVLDNDGKIYFPTSKGDLCIGMLQQAARLGEVARVMLSGVSGAIYGEQIATANILLTGDDDGRLVVADPGDYVIALSLEAGEADEYHPVLIGYIPQLSPVI